MTGGKVLETARPPGDGSGPAAGRAARRFPLLPASRSGAWLLSACIVLMFFLAGGTAFAGGDWAWMAGSPETNRPGIYGTMGEPGPENMPGSRAVAAVWKDASGALWLFGGWGFDGMGREGSLNDLWKYDPASGQWTWMKGGNGVYAAGSYGTMGVPGPGNAPGGRYAAVTWRDASGALWLFGGWGFDGERNQGFLNDLWKYDPVSGNWTWMAGSDKVNQGTIDTGTGRTPGGREAAVSWRDASGVLWLFGGWGHDAANEEGWLNDLWRCDPAAGSWIFVKGGTGIDEKRTYGNRGEPGSVNLPGGRNYAASWSDGAGRLWLFGGCGVDGYGNRGDLNDLWCFETSSWRWTWMKGSDRTERAGNYGTQGTPAPDNTPGARNYAVVWPDVAGSLWLFGGCGFDRERNQGWLNDLWRYDPVTGDWTWMKGSDKADGAGIYGTPGTPGPDNTPVAKGACACWGDVSGDLWLFGGQCAGATWNDGFMSDLWRYVRTQDTATVTFETDGTPGASLSGETTQTVSLNGDCTPVTAVAPAGYHFEEWTKNAERYSTENPLTVRGLTCDMTLVARFAVNRYTLTYRAGTNGSISGNASQVVAHGESGTEVRAVPNNGYRFNRWSDGSTANPRTDTNVTADIDVTALFVEILPDPAPKVTSLEPSSVKAGSGVFTLTVKGEDFGSGSKVRWNGVDRVTQYKSVTVLTATILAGDVSQAGSATVTVLNGDGQVSNGVAFTIDPSSPTAPKVTLLNPSSVKAGNGAFPLGVIGENFYSGSKARWNGVERVTRYLSATVLEVSILAGDVSQAGSATVTVVNADGKVSNGVAFTIIDPHPAPKVTSLDPSSVKAGSGAFTLTVKGENFGSGSKVRWNGVDRVTQYKSVTVLTATILAGDVSQAGSATVTVVNADGKVSNGVAFTIIDPHPAPKVTSLDPSSVKAGSGAFTLTVKGENFGSGSKVRWNGVDRVTQYKSVTVLTATILAGDVSQAGSATMTVVNADGKVSNDVAFTIDPPPAAPKVTSLNPSSVKAGSGTFTLTVKGSGFAGSSGSTQGSVVRWNGASRVTTWVSDVRLDAKIGSGDIVSAGKATVTVKNGDGQVSNGVVFTIEDALPAVPTPVVTGISPSSAVEGDPELTLSVTGRDFSGDARVLWDGRERKTTRVRSGTELSAVLPAPDLAVPGRHVVTVFNPGTAGQSGKVSNGMNFTVRGKGGEQVIPTLNEWGMIVLMVLVGAAAVLRMRRRRPA
ncbi:MAG TPA: IPTL-CTERM sorting domain-containing protein [Syntrophales bacterium]|nr:IPTL-CTERM sorting domain-containing protein [Syntrophales bacterium]